MTALSHSCNDTHGPPERAETGNDRAQEQPEGFAPVREAPGLARGGEPYRHGQAQKPPSADAVDPGTAGTCGAGGTRPAGLRVAQALGTDHLPPGAETADGGLPGGITRIDPHPCAQFAPGPHAV